jgi:hypothetical protein
MSNPTDRLRAIKSFPDLVRYLEEELDWSLAEYDFKELTFDYQPAELGLKEADAAKVKAIRQLRPLQHKQPWGIFFVEFEKKRMPVVVLRSKGGGWQVQYQSLRRSACRWWCYAASSPTW